ncbi:MBL fold metallo-hydrolase [uncultured Pseudodesulfovibrio sp.]|uniref:MBL fold metallo-hydrolase n=1 Tax=uncultured Pseudodesulfovibrio sp. TaxID=2035858 RepID=UPI0029C962B2|nr:MBL fold metallo-hydrolase [uncultured Pseudodesulfovibrio sp.]
MELTFLVDNNSLIGTQFLAEPALSMFIQDGDKNILFDAGYSNAFMINAQRKGIDLLDLDWIALSPRTFRPHMGIGLSDSPSL